ncbi:DUF551 domain-containing protein [Intestinimonas timonensis]|uniref:DUF551 domain-containing protein n=1 Tax=Intestinimonas timonensis TaxID=1689270 RepID=UPI0023F0E2AE|nr:DUF551 domain-containing protein [Intestinimonas timonensis]
MAKSYRKKPVMIEAVQWTGENHAEMCEFIDPEAFEIIPRVGLVIHTLEGDHYASPGDYIIKGINGEFYPCKPDIFAKTYESATLTPPNEWVSVEERLPEPGGRVLAANGSFVGEAYMASNGAWMRHDGFPWEVDAWMPMPDRRPPEGEEDI